jgi:hypothetical protein
VFFDNNVTNCLLKIHFISLLHFHFSVIYYFRGVAAPPRNSTLIHYASTILLLFPTSGRNVMLHKGRLDLVRNRYRIENVGKINDSTVLVCNTVTGQFHSY